jgi:Holliday junction resolvase-like predicted endonuclease
MFCGEIIANLIQKWNYALHGNTGNPHVHIVVNRTHPYTEKVIQPHRGFDIEEGHRIAALIEHKQGWASQANARYRVNEKGDIARNQKFKSWREAIKPDLKPRGKAEDFESATGEKSAQRIAQERGRTIIKTAKSWKELHEKLAAVGLRFEKKGSGAIVFAGDIAVKASSIDRNFGLSKLCKRLGEYEAGEYPPANSDEDKPKIEPEPASDVCAEEWREYRQTRADDAARQRNDRKRIAADMRKIRVRQREQRREALAALAPRGLPILNIARHFLREQQQAELSQLRADTPLPKRRPVKCFKAWLAQRSARLANLWRFRRRIQPGMEVRKCEFPKVGNLASPYRAYRELFQKRMAGEHMDESRLDAMIALRMRLSGYSFGDVGNEMYRQARPLRQEREHRDWKDYARRMVWYAFGAAGDIDIAAFKPTTEIIQKFHKEAQEIEAARTRETRREEQPQYRMRL